jgi:hypothetical protein
MAQSTIYPKEITVEQRDTGNLHIASFGYYDGVEHATELGLKQTTSFKEVNQFTHFIVCCGDVMVRVEEQDYPEIDRRILK